MGEFIFIYLAWAVTKVIQVSLIPMPLDWIDPLACFFSELQLLHSVFFASAFTWFFYRFFRLVFLGDFLLSVQ